MLHIFGESLLTSCHHFERLLILFGSQQVQDRDRTPSVMSRLRRCCRPPVAVPPPLLLAVGAGCCPSPLVLVVGVLHETSASPCPTRSGSSAAFCGLTPTSLHEPLCFSGQCYGIRKMIPYSVLSPIPVLQCGAAISQHPAQRVA